MTSSFRGHIPQCVFSIIFLMTSLPSMTSSINVVETLVFVDNTAQAKWNKTARGVAKTDMETEVRSMMLEVNEIYKGIPSLNIRIHLKDLVMLKQDVTFPNSAGSIDAKGAMGHFENYLTRYQNRRYDMALLLTGQSLHGVSIFDGYANMDSVCTKQSAAIITLEPTPRTVYIIAHEIGHVLGARHDGDANNCDKNKKYLMSWSSLLTENRYKLSSCSKRSIQYTTYYRVPFDRHNCLADKQDVKDDTVPRFGSLMTGDSMCKRYYGSQSYFARKFYSKGYGDNVCLEVTCFKKKDKKTGKLKFYYKPSGDGLYCGKNKQCIRGKCVQTSTGLSTISDSCPFGDQPIIEDSNKTCKQVTASECKDKKYARPCCHTCKK